MAKILASLLALLVFAQVALADTIDPNIFNTFPSTCKKNGQVHLFYAEGPAASTAQLLVNLNGVLDVSKLTFFPVTTYLKDVTSNVPLKSAASGGAIIGQRWATAMNLSTASSTEIINQLNSDCTTIQQYTGKVPKYIFLPQAQLTASSVATVTGQGYVPIGYNIDSGDYAYASSNSDAACIAGITQNYVTQLVKLPNGTATYIAANRDLYTCSATAAPYVVRTVQAFNYTIVDLATCLGDSTPYRSSCGGGSTAATTAGSSGAATTAGSSATTTKAADAASTSTAGTKSAAGSLKYSIFTTVLALVGVAVAFVRL